MNRLRCGMLLVMSVFISACGGNASLSPTAPSRTSGASSGAVISGQVSSSSLPATTRSTADTLATASVSSAGTLATASVMVKIVGTNITTTTDGQGQFTLTGVPPGDVKLEFTGPGGTATISLSGVQADDAINITVTLNGSNAHVDSERRGKNGNQNQQGQNQQGQGGSDVTGAVSGLTGSCPALTFTVQGTKVTTSASTSFEDVTCAGIKNGTVVEVNGPKGSDGTIAATKVEGDDNNDDNEDDDHHEISQALVKGAVSGISGTCPALTFTVQNTKVTTTASTKFEDVSCRSVKNGTVVQASGSKQADGSITATKVSHDD